MHENTEVIENVTFGPIPGQKPSSQYPSKHLYSTYEWALINICQKYKLLKKLENKNFCRECNADDRGKNNIAVLVLGKKSLKCHN